MRKFSKVQISIQHTIARMRMIELLLVFSTSPLPFIDLQTNKHFTIVNKHVLCTSAITSF